MDIRRQRPPRSAIGDRFLLTLAFDELAGIYAACQEALRSMHHPPAAIEAFVHSVDRAVCRSVDALSKGRFEQDLAVGPTPPSAIPEPRTLNPEPSQPPLLLLGPGGRYQRAYGPDDFTDGREHLSLIQEAELNS